MKKNSKKRVLVAMSLHKSLRDYARQAGGRKKRVLVAMSGGVDSSVAAALLKKQGYDVAGVFMHFWAEPAAGGQRAATNTCCSEGAEAAARLVAAKLSIPFYTLNFEREFKKEVVDYFLAEEKRGRTPNPCVVCNKKIKFGLLFDKALKTGADFIATGHYAIAKNGRLFKGIDGNKDQSYFLYNLNSQKLKKILLPLGDYKKEQVYKLAKKMGLPYRQDESFDLCFVSNDRAGFIKRYLKMKSGKIMDLSGKILGSHEGLALYTIGQRKRLPIVNGPWWVVKKDERKEILFVTNKEKNLYSDCLIAEKTDWIHQPAKFPIKTDIKIRYKSDAARATLRQAQGKNQLEVIFEKPQRAITPGQSAVFYKKDEVLGGGLIV